MLHFIKRRSMIEMLHNNLQKEYLKCNKDINYRPFDNNLIQS
jgi:hypothetical protein